MVAALAPGGTMVTMVVSTMSGTQRDAAVWQTLARVPDPEIPVLSIVDLGIVRSVEWQADELIVTVTPTYSGCPATELIMSDIGRALASAGFAKHRLEIRLSPAWTTDWIAAISSTIACPHEFIRIHS